MKKIKQLFFVTAFVSIFVFALSISANAASTGKCGDNLTYTLTDKVLTISGTGDMYDYEPYETPWIFEDIDKIIFGSGITRIGNYAFDCIEPEFLAIPSSLKSIGESALAYAHIPLYIMYSGVESGWNKISIAEGNFALETTVFFYGRHSNPLDYGSCGDNADYVILPNGKLIVIGTGEISPNAYSGKFAWNSVKSQIKEVEILTGITGIQKDAFKNCTNIKTITIPDTMESIGNNVFYGCKALENIYWNARNMTDFTPSSDVFYTAGTSGNGIALTFGDSVESIPANAFYSRSAAKFKSVTLSDSIISIGKDAFFNRAAIEKVNINNISSWLKIDFETKTSNPLYYAKNLYIAGNLITDVTVPDGFTKIPDFAFLNCTSIKSIEISDGVTTIGCNAFDGCTGLTEVIIPKTVSTIEQYAFSGCSSIAGIELPEGIADIKAYTFNGCTGLKNITIPSGVTTIGEYAFKSCTALTEVIFPKTVSTIEQYAFSECSSIADIELPEGIVNINAYTFNKCTGLKNITIPSGVTTIGKYAFYYCSGLTELTIPSGVTSIGEYAFYSCSNLSELTIPKSMTTIGNHAFRSCGKLSKINYPDTQSSWNSINIGSYNDSIMSAAIYFTDGIGGICGDEINWELSSEGTLVISGNGSMKNYYVNTVPWKSLRSDITKVIINSGVTHIGNYTFRLCSNITEIVIADSMTTIGESAFESCKGLTSITIPDNVTKIYNSAFKHCTGLTSITIPDSVTSIGSDIFYNCTGLTNINIPDGITDITSSAFYNCTGLSTIQLPKSIKYIAKYAFKNCSQLQSITFPEGIKAIEEEAFLNCTKLTDIELPDSIIRIGKHAFDNSGYYTNNSNWENGILYIDNHLIAAKPTISGDIKIKAGTIVVAAGAFSDCINLQSINIPDSVINIGAYAFKKCTSLTNVVLSKNISTIYIFTFAYCSSLENIEIPKGVEFIYDNAFYECSNLKNIKLPVGVTKIGDYAFFNCKALTNITLPDSIENMGAYIFYGCSNLKSIAIPPKVTEIKHYSFFECTSLKELKIPENLYRIHSHAFYNCTGLERIYYNAKNSYNYDTNNNLFYRAGQKGSGIELILGEAVERLPSCLFYPSTTSGYHPKIVSITIPDNSIRMQGSAFYNCADLSDVYYYGDEASWNSKITVAGTNVLKNATIHYNCRPVHGRARTSTPVVTSTSVTSTITNKLETDLETQIYVAIYNADGSLSHIGLAEQTLGADNETDFSYDISVSENQTVKLFVWEQGIMQPLAAVSQ